MSAPSARSSRLEDGKAAARLCALNVVAQLKAALRRRSRPRQALREARRIRQCDAWICAASGSGQWRIGSLRRSLRRCGTTCARGGRRRFASAQCGDRSGGHVRDRVTNAPLTARLAGSAAEIGAAAWNACANPRGAPTPHPFTRYEFFVALEGSGSAMRARPVGSPVISSSSAKMLSRACCRFTLKSHSQGEYVFDHGWADAFESAGGRYYPKAAGLRAIHPGDGSAPAVAAPIADDTRRALLAATRFARRERIGASSLHITFLTEDEWKPRHDARLSCNAPTSNSTGKIAATRASTIFWANCLRRKRKNLRKERAAVHEAGVSNSTGSPAATSPKRIGTRSSNSTWTRAAANGAALISRANSSAASVTAWAKQILLVLALPQWAGNRRRAEFLRRRRSLRPQLGVHANTSPFCISRPATIRPSTSRSHRDCREWRPAPRASTNCCAVTCRCQPTVPISSHIPACVGRLPTYLSEERGGGR